MQPSEPMRRPRSGRTGVWFCAAAVAVAVLMIVSLLSLVAVRGLGHFWPGEVQQARYEVPGQPPRQLIGEVVGVEQVPRERLARLGLPLPDSAPAILERELWHLGGGPGESGFVWVLGNWIHDRQTPAGLWRVPRRDGGDLLGYPQSLITPSGAPSAGAIDLPAVLAEQLALPAAKRLPLTLRLDNGNGALLDVPLGDIQRAYPPNTLDLPARLHGFLSAIAAYLEQNPRHGGGQGGVFPALVGTLTMTLLMAVIATPLGVIAAIYLHEYARRTWLTRLIRIAVNNLAGVPSIVYGVFGLGFFVYVLGGSLDQLFFAERLPTPTFGTPGLLWASLTLALLTMPVVIVATEEGLAPIPYSLREGSLALGATQAETLWRVVLPMASPALMTGLVLAVARAAGEVAPLMLVGVAKLAPSLPLDLHAPYLHLERKFMHLGFQIYDIAFQSNDVEAAQSLVYATALLLILLIVALNMTAVTLRTHLREKYQTLES